MIARLRNRCEKRPMNETEKLCFYLGAGGMVRESIEENERLRARTRNRESFILFLFLATILVITVAVGTYRIYDLSR